MHTFQTLNLKGFITCTLQKDYSVLAQRDEERLEENSQARQDAWTKISSDYYELLGDKSIKNYISQSDRMQILALRIIAYTEIVNVLRVFHFDALAQHLRNEFGLELDPEDKELYTQDLDRVLIELKADEIELAQLKGMAEEKRESEPQQEQTEDNFDEMLMEIYTNLIHSPITDLETIKEEMIIKTYVLYVKKLKQYYLEKANKPIM